MRVRPGTLLAIVVAMASVLLLPACTTTSGDCSLPCNPDERFPAGLVRFAEKHVDALDGAGPSIRLRRGRLEGSVEAAEYVSELARPGDVIATTNRGALTAQLIPGYFTHTAAYVGTERQLRALGIWDHRAVRPLHAEIRAGKVAIEATGEGVHLSPVAKLLDADRFLLARPGGTDGLSSARRRDAVLALISRLGLPFDYHFDAATSGALFCVELLQRSIPELKLPNETIYGRPTIKPVSLAEAVFRPSAPLGFVVYLKGDKDGFQGVSREDLQKELIDARARELQRAGCGGEVEGGKKALKSAG